ncbi:MAG: patatin-like phospholipase family protein [Spirochaetales bacterium]
MKLADRFKKVIDNIKTKFSKNPKKVKEPKYKIGLALGGGGTRGMAHLGAIKAFEENGIEFDYIAGTSVGSLVGALYANGMKSERMIEIAKELKTNDIKTSKIPFVPNKTDKLEDLIKQYVGDITFADLQKPFCAVAVDMVSAKEVDIESGSVVKAVAGSCAVPAIFNAVEFENLTLMDGGILNTIPAKILRNKGCKYVVAVDVNPSRGSGTKSKKLIDLLAATIRIMMTDNANKGKEYADIVIEPNTKRFKSTKTEGGVEMIEEGYLATMEKMDEIKKLLKIKPEKIQFKDRWQNLKNRTKKIFTKNKTKTVAIEEEPNMEQDDIIEE